MYRYNQKAQIIVERTAHTNPKHFDYSALCSWLHETYFIRGQGDITKQIALNQGISKGQISEALEVIPAKAKDISCPKCLCQCEWFIVCLFLEEPNGSSSIDEKNKKKVICCLCLYISFISASTAFSYGTFNFQRLDKK